MKPRAFVSTSLVPATPWRTAIVLGAMLLALIFTQGEGVAQSCTECVLYAGTELNLRRDPRIDAMVMRFIPRGAAVQRTAGAEQNGYAPVIYDGVPGWAVALGFVTTLKEVDEFVVPAASTASPAPTATPASTTAPSSQAAPAASDEARVTLGTLLLRSGPAGDAEPILTMPEGAVVTLTREGAENGYVTVDYDGTTGWVYADLIGEAAAAS